jgi:hypothetical protein
MSAADVPQPTAAEPEFPSWIMNNSIDPSKAVEQVSDFAAHTKDYKVTLDQLMFRNDPDGQLRLCWKRPSGDTYFLPQPSWFAALARYLNTHTGDSETSSHGISRSSGKNLYSLYARAAFSVKQSVTLAEAVNDKHVQSSSSIYFKPATSLMLNALIGELDDNYRAKDKARKELLLRAMIPGTSKRWCKENTARALMFDGYRGDISHKWLLESMHRLTLTGRVTRWHFDGELMKGGWLIPKSARAEADSNYAGGIFFYQGEIGNRRCGILPFVYREASDTMTIFGSMVGAGWSVIHSTSQDLDDLYDGLAKMVHKQLDLVSVAIEKVIQAKEQLAPADVTIEQLLLAITRGGEFSKTALRTWRDFVIDEQELFQLPLSVFTLQNGLGRLAKGTDDPVQQMKFEIFSGALLDQNWKSLCGIAQNIGPDRINKTFEVDA